MQPDEATPTGAPEPPDLGVLDSLESELADIERVVERIEAGDTDHAEPAADVNADLASGPTESEGPAVESGPLQSGPPPDEEQAMGFGIDKLGHWTEGPEFQVGADRTKAYAAATNDPNPAH